MTKPQQKADLVTTQQFRAWLRLCVDILPISEFRLSQLSGCADDTIGSFLRNPGRGIYLEKAAAIEVAVRDVATKRGYALPELNAPQIEAVCE